MEAPNILTTVFTNLCIKYDNIADKSGFTNPLFLSGSSPLSAPVPAAPAENNAETFYINHTMIMKAYLSLVLPNCILFLIQKKLYFSCQISPSPSHTKWLIMGTALYIFIIKLSHAQKVRHPTKVDVFFTITQKKPMSSNPSNNMIRLSIVLFGNTKDLLQNS